jgi:hypothetical protein
MAENKRLHIQHYYTTTSGKTPSVDNVVLGEIAVGAKANDEKLFIRNSDNEIVKFLPEGADASYAESGHTHTHYLDKNSTESQTVEGPIKFSNGIEVYDDNAGEKLVANFKLVGDTPIINVGEGGDYVLHTGNVTTGEGLEVDTMGGYTLSISEDYQEKINKGVTALESFNAFITGVTDADQTINTLKEIQDYITQDVKDFGDLTATVNDIQDDISNLEINQVTEATVSGWGFTKNTGTYSKPSGGIPKGDLASDVQNLLNNATTAAYGVTKLSSATNSSDETTAATPKAVKSAYDLADGKYTKPSGGIPKTDLASAVQNSLDKANSALQSETYKGTITGVTAGSGLTGGGGASSGASTVTLAVTCGEGLTIDGENRVALSTVEYEKDDTEENGTFCVRDGDDSNTIVSMIGFDDYGRTSGYTFRRITTISCGTF